MAWYQLHDDDLHVILVFFLNVITCLNKSETKFNPFEVIFKLQAGLSINILVTQIIKNFELFF